VLRESDYSFLASTLWDSDILSFIEGIVSTSSRINALMKEKTTPWNRDEKEIAEYRDMLNTIHESYDYMPSTKTFENRLLSNNHCLNRAKILSSH